MPRYILKLDEWYFEWSTIVDAPVTYKMTLKEFKEHYQYEYGAHGMKGLPERLARVEAHGTSANPAQTVDQLISFNRAGENEENLSKEMIIKQYTYVEEQENKT